MANTHPKNDWIESINESIIYLTKTPNIKKQSKISQQIVVDQIFDLLNKLFLNEIHKNKNLPISYKQFSSNTFMNNMKFFLEKNTTLYRKSKWYSNR